MRLGVRVGIALALGAITSFAVAAMCAARADRHNGQYGRWGERLVAPGGVPVAVPTDGRAPPNTMYFEFRAVDDRGVTFAYSRLRAFSNYTPAAPPLVHPPPEAATRRWERSRVTPWTTGDRAWPADNATEHMVHAKAAGWPLRCFWCEVYGRTVPSAGGGYDHDYRTPGGVAFRNALQRGWADWPPDYPVVIPLRPMAPELAANSVVYGAAWMLPLMWVPLRRLRRRRRGLCEACGYDRGGIGQEAACPECGRPAATRR